MENNRSKSIAPNVILLSIVSFLNDLSSEMIMPILPMFLASLGGTGKVIGLVGGLQDSISGILKVLSGHWSDRTGKRKIFVYCGYAISSSFKLLLALSRAWPTAVAFASLERLGKGIRTAARDAIIADSMPAAKGKGFGIHRALDTTGAIMGALVAFSLYWFLKLDFKLIILAAGLIGFAALAPLRFVRDSRLGVTDYRMGGRFQIGRPTHFLEMVIQNSLMPKKTSLPKARYSLNRKGKLSNSR